METERARRCLTLSRVTVSVVAAFCVSITVSCQAPAENEGGRVSTEAQKSGAGELHGRSKIVLGAVERSMTKLVIFGVSSR